MADLPLDILVQAKGAAQAATQINAVDRSVQRLGSTARTSAGAGFGSALSRGVGAAEKSVSKLGGALGHAQRQVTGLLTGPLGLIGLGTGIFGIAGAFDATIGGATRFDAAMELLRTQTGATQGEVDSMKKAVLGLGGTLPQTPEELAAGLYHVESAGFRGAKALQILKVAAQGAMTGNADLESVTNALVGAEQSGIKGAEDYGTAMGTLNAIVGAGNMRMQDLVDSFGSGILASARTFGVSLQSVGSALATMTDEGIPAIDAATRLRMSLSLMGAPTSAARKQLKGIGLDQYDLAKAMRSPGGFVSAIGLLREHMMKAGLIGPDGNPNPQGAALLSHAFGGGRSSAAIMTLLSNFTLLEQKQKAVNEGGAHFSDSVTAAADQAATKFKTFRSAIDAAAIQVGNVFLPMLTDAVKTLGDWITSHQDQIVGWAKDLTKGVRDAGTFIHDYVIPAVKGIAGAWNGLPGPLKDLLVKGFVAGKVTKFLFDFGPLDALKAGGGLLGKLGGEFFKRGSTPVNPLFVKDVGLPGGLPPVGGAAGAAEEGAAAAGGVSVGGIIKGAVKFVLPIAAGIAIANVIREAAGITPEQAAEQNSRGQFGPRTPQQIANRAPGGVSSQVLGERAGNARARDTAGYLKSIGRDISLVRRDTDKLPHIADQLATANFDPNLRDHDKLASAFDDAFKRDVKLDTSQIIDLRKGSDETTAAVNRTGSVLAGKVGNFTPQFSRLAGQNQSLIGKVGNITPQFSRLSGAINRTAAGAWATKGAVDRKHLVSNVRVSVATTISVRKLQSDQTRIRIAGGRYIA